jgi:hypothetical protein
VRNRHDKRQITGFHDEKQECAAPATVYKLLYFDDTASHFPIPLCVDAWEGQMVIFVSPDTGQNK